MSQPLPARPPNYISHTVPSFGPMSLFVAVLIVAGLYVGREILVPIALAVLLSFVLAPVVRLLQRIHLPRIVAVFLTVLVAFAGIFALGGLMVSQVNDLASDLPRYQSTLREKIQSLRGVATGSGTLERASEVLQDLSKELEPRKDERRSATPAARDKPIPVEVRQPDPGALQTLAALITPVLHPLASAGIVLIFLIFILMQQQDLRNRLVRLAGSHDLQRTTAAMNDAGHRLSRLFMTQLLLNAFFGVVIGAGLWLIGVPSAPLWGLMAMILRFVPYIGAIISAVLPLIIAAAVGSDWSMALWTALLFLIVEPIVGHVIEPLVYGHSSGLSPVAVVASATFWTWLWGPIGLILATPLTICLVVLGRHVDRLKFLDVLLGDQPALTATETLYQRLLAGDPIEATEQAEKFLKEKPLIAWYDEVLLGALRLAEADAERGSLDRERLQRVRDTVAEIVEDLEDHEDPAEDVPASESESPLAPISKVENGTPRPAPRLPEKWRAERAVMCLPGVGLLDETVALPLAQLLKRQGLGACAEEAEALSMARLFALDTANAVLICLCYLEPATPAQIRYAARRIRRKAPQAAILVSLFRESDNVEDPVQESDGIPVVTGSFAATVKRIVATAESAAEAPPVTKVPLPRSA